MRYGLVLTAALIAGSAIAVSAGTARADDEWCGYTTDAKSIIECGYSTMAKCEDAVDKGGKGGMCFVDPDYALEIKHAMPLFRPLHAIRPS